jgi:flagellin-like protein
MSLFSNLKRWLRDERGITGLETAIILIAFVVVATVFSSSS